MRFWPFGRSRKTETRTSPENLTYADLFGCEEDSRTKAAHIKSNALESLKYPAVWRAVSLISADVAKLPLNIWLDDPDDDKVDRRRAKRMPSYKLLRYRPNEYQTAFQYRRNQMAVALLYGNHYSLIIRDDDGRPTALIPLPSKGETYPVFESDGTMYYKTESRNGQMSKLEAQDVLHIRGLSSDGFMGVPFNQYASDSLGLGLSEQRYTSIYFENGGKPAMYLKVPKGLQDTEIKKIKKSWQELHTGINEQHKTAVLQGDIEVEELNTKSAQDAQLIEGREFEIKQVANWFGVPPRMLGDNSGVAYNTLEQESQQYLNQTLDPWLVAYEEECNSKLIPQKSWLSGGAWCEFNREAVLRADLNTRSSYYQTAITNGWLNRNEVRQREGLNPIKGGDTYLLPVQGQVAEGGSEDVSD